MFDGFDERLERPVAVKILRPQTLALPGMRRRFQREAQIAARLTHPNIVAVLDFGEDGSASYLVMERLPGTTLRDEIASGPLTNDRVLLVLSETLSALSAAHRFGVLHRDIKPSNILVQEDGHTKITDFGIAKPFEVGVDPGRLGDDMTLTGIVLGTPGYLAPERRSGLPATVQSDLYSVGAVMLEALTRRRPPHRGERNERLHQPFRDVVLGAMAAEPGDRYRSAADMLHALQKRPPISKVASRPEGTALLAPTVAASTDRPTRERPGTEILPSSCFPQPSRGHTHTRRHRALLVAVSVATLVVTLFLLLDTWSQPTGPAAAGSTHHSRLARQQDTDPARAAIRNLATALADGGFSGDTGLANALASVAAQPPGAARQAAAQRALSLAQVLVDRGDITSGQYQDVQSALQPTGASVPAPSPTIATIPPATISTPGSHGHGQDHDHGGQGSSEDHG